MIFRLLRGLNDPLLFIIKNRRGRWRTTTRRLDGLSVFRLRRGTAAAKVVASFSPPKSYAAATLRAVGNSERINIRTQRRRRR